MDPGHSGASEVLGTGLVGAPWVRGWNEAGSEAGTQGTRPRAPGNSSLQKILPPSSPLPGVASRCEDIGTWEGDVATAGFVLPPCVPSCPHAPPSSSRAIVVPRRLLGRGRLWALGSRSLVAAPSWRGKGALSALAVRETLRPRVKDRPRPPPSWVEPGPTGRASGSQAPHLSLQQAAKSAPSPELKQRARSLL